MNSPLSGACKFVFPASSGIKSVATERTVQIVVYDTLMSLEGTREPWTNKKV